MKRNEPVSRIMTRDVKNVRILKEQLESDGRRLRFTDDQRRRLASKGKPLGRKALNKIESQSLTPFLAISYGIFGAITKLTKTPLFGF